MTASFKKGDKVVIDADTVYDLDGLPVSVRPGVVKGIVHEVEDGWAQVLCADKGGPHLLGCDVKSLSARA